MFRLYEVDCEDVSFICECVGSESVVECVSFICVGGGSWSCVCVSGVT